MTTSSRNRWVAASSLLAALNLGMLATGCDEGMQADEFEDGGTGGKQDAAAGDPDAESPFADVPTNHPYYDEISLLFHEGIVAGSACGASKPCFRPEDHLKRYEAISALYSVLKRASIAGGNACQRAPFVADMADHPAKEAVEQAYCAGWINLDTDTPEGERQNGCTERDAERMGVDFESIQGETCFHPNAGLTRAQAYITIVKSLHLRGPGDADDDARWAPLAPEDEMTVCGSLGCGSMPDLSAEDRGYVVRAIEQDLLSEAVNIERSFEPDMLREDAAVAIAYALFFDSVSE